VGDGVTKWADLSYLVASSEAAGLVKMYSETGTNEDGTMTQKSITDALNSKIGISLDGDSETIILN
jgi:hypothetical protein